MSRKETQYKSVNKIVEGTGFEPIVKSTTFICTPDLNCLGKPYNVNKYLGWAKFGGYFQVLLQINAHCNAKIIS